MGITVEHDYFTDTDAARAEIEGAGLHLHDVDAPPSGGTPIHWSGCEIQPRARSRYCFT